MSLYRGSAAYYAAGRLPYPPPRVGKRWEDVVLREAGFTGRRVELDTAAVVTRTTEEIVALTSSLSIAAPYRFSDRLPQFEADLRALRERTSPCGLFAERTRAIALHIWRPS